MQDLVQVVECVPDGDGRTEHAGMGDHAKEFIDARPGNGPEQRAFRQTDDEFSRRAVVFRRDDLGLDQDIRVDGLHASSPIHQIEEFVAVEQIDIWLLDGAPAAELDPDPLSRRRLGQRLPKQFIGDILKRATFPDRFFFQPSEKVVINSQGRSSHASKCRCKHQDVKPESVSLTALWKGRSTAG